MRRALGVSVSSLYFFPFVLLLNFSPIFAKPFSPPAANLLVTEMNSFERVHVLGSKQWSVYRNHDEDTFRHYEIETAKAIFYLSRANGSFSFLVSRKKHKRGSKKDNKWEFPGGRLEDDEPLFQALYREVKEEDVSQILASHLLRVQRSTPLSLTYKLVPLKKKDYQGIFLVPLPEETFKRLQYYYETHDHTNFETYGFELVSEFDLARRESKKWTPKSVKILEALSRN